MEQPDKLSVFILEDDCERIQEFSKLFVNCRMIVTNCAETAILFLNSYKFDTILLDHDLGGEVFVHTRNKNTGSEVCREINDLNRESQVIIHSWNKVGAENMRLNLGGKGFTNVTKEFFGGNLLDSIRNSLK
jgi:DNA-binding response OmpR family regulator